MVDKHLSDRRLDEAIDRAVRDMMSVEPRADLRARVLAELGGGRTRVALWPRLAWASAALALIFAIATMILQRPSDRRDETQVATVQPSTSPRETPPDRPSQSVGTPPTGSRGSTPAAKRPRTHEGTSVRPTTTLDRPIQAASIDTLDAVAVEPVVTVDRLHPIEPIGIASLGALGVSTSEIVINPISLEPVDVTPLSPRR